MQQILSTIKNSLEESKKRIESGNHESHDLLPSLLLILVELLEKNSEKYEKFQSKQEELLTEEGVKRKDDYSSLVKDSIEVKWALKEINTDFLKKLEVSFEQFQSKQQNIILEYISRNKVNNIIIFTLLWLSLIINTILLILFIVK